MDISSFQLEEQLYQEGYDFVIGIDEAGRGPLAGPVVAAATTARNSQFLISNFQTNSNDKSLLKNLCLIRDSKTLSEKQREKLYDFICENFHVGIGICDHATIDRINILEATYLAMKKAVVSLSHNMKHETYNTKTKGSLQNETLFQVSKNIILVDGNKVIPNFSMEQRAIVNGDKIVKSISAASIIAKVTRDRMMVEAHSKFPQYDFIKHKGYGTKIHMEALGKYGPCEIHRRSFGPVKACNIKHKTRDWFGNRI